MAISELPRHPDFSSFSAKELILRQIETERLETIPLESVLTENAIIDDAHAEELGKSMLGKRGQITPIAVRVRLSEGIPIYDVIDGFHRAEGRKKNGLQDVKANVIYGCPDEEMFDLRILAASSVRSVQFARVVEWITKSWETTEWSKKGLSVTQAFTKTINDREKAYGIKLSPQELSEIKDWVKEKCNRWGRGIGSTYGMLHMVSNADPELVKKVRLSSGGKDREGKITPDRLRTVVEAFPNNFEAQRSLLRVITERRYYAEEARELVEKAQQLIAKDEADENEVYELANRITIKTVVSVKPKNNTQAKPIQGREISRKPIFGNPLLLQSSEIAKLNSQLEEARGELRRTYWWRQAEYLTIIEKICMERILFGNQSIELVCKDLKITEQQAFGIIRSAILKRHEREDERIPLLN